MGKGNGGTRSNGTSTGGVVPAPVDEYAAWRAVEGSERYKYDPEKVKFSVDAMDIGGEFSRAEMAYKSDFEYEAVQRDMTDGKYHINESEYIYNEPKTFNQAIKQAVTFAKERYQNNEGMRDQMYMVRNYEDDNAPSAWVTAELVGDNKVRIHISRFHA